MQIVGKVKLKLSPFLNQWWEVALYVTPRGMTTGRIPYEDMAFEVSFDFLAHTLLITTSAGEQQCILLAPRTVAAFYREFMSALSALGIDVTITSTPSEITHPIPFAEDTQHASYDEEYVDPTGGKYNCTAVLCSTGSGPTSGGRVARYNSFGGPLT